MGFVRAASTKDIAPGKMTDAELDGKPILIANVGSKYYAMGNICAHMGCMLSDGTLRNGQVQCQCHGSVFDLKTGNVVRGPASEPEPSYDVKVEGNQILVNV